MVLVGGETKDVVEVVDKCVGRWWQLDEDDNSEDLSGPSPLADDGLIEDEAAVIMVDEDPKDEDAVVVIDGAAEEHEDE